MPNQVDQDDMETYYNPNKEPDYHTYMAINPDNYDDHVAKPEEWDHKSNPPQLF